jgi:hypothetical protein
MKCLVYGCENTSEQGRFVGELCVPCREMLRTGLVSPGNKTFIGKLNENSNRLEEVESAAEDFKTLC